MTAALASPSYLALGRCTQAELEQVLLRGETPDLGGIAGWEYRGMNIAFWAPYSPIQKFIKGFYRSPDGRVFGYNEPVVQNGPERRWVAKPSDDDPKRFGFYSVESVDPSSRDNEYLHALLLDYSKGGNPLLDPSKRLRDYIVRVNPGSDELLLGKAYLAFGKRRVATNFFALERHRPTDWVR
jgi:hypothetical protein